MVKANLDGRKTETRRMLKLKFHHDHNWKPTLINEKHFDGIDRWEMRCGTQYTLPTFKCPYGQPGDILWVRETWAPALGDYAYKADYSESVIKEERNKGLWKPSIHMPKEACRMFLLLKEVKIERLHDISEESAIAEGIGTTNGIPVGIASHYLDYTDSKNCYTSPINSYQSLWQSINGEDSWYQNPWLWVLKYEVLKCEDMIVSLKDLHWALLDRKFDGAVVARSIHNFKHNIKAK
jgi:hypothetical protein